MKQLFQALKHWFVRLVDKVRGQDHIVSVIDKYAPVTMVWDSDKYHILFIRDGAVIRTFDTRKEAYDLPQFRVSVACIAHLYGLTSEIKHDTEKYFEIVLTPPQPL